MANGMKRLAKETAVYGLSSIIGRFLNWLLVPRLYRYGRFRNRNEPLRLGGTLAGIADVRHGDGFFPVHQ